MLTVFICPQRGEGPRLYEVSELAERLNREPLRRGTPAAKRRGLALLNIAVGLAMIVLTVLVFGLTTASGGLD